MKLSVIPTKTWVVAVVGLVLIIVIIVIASPKSSELTGQTNPAGVVIPRNVTFYTGIVTYVDDNGIIIRANAENNYLTESQTIRVFVDPKTEIVLLVSPTNAADDEAVATEEKTADLTYIQFGQEVTAYADRNIGGKTEFTATRIETTVLE